MSPGRWKRRTGSSGKDRLAALEPEGSVIRARTADVKVKVDCRMEGNLVGSVTFVGGDQPSYHRGTSALHPGYLEFDERSGTLGSEGSGCTVKARTEREVKMLGSKNRN
jgi:hypothetical protein